MPEVVVLDLQKSLYGVSKMLVSLRNTIKIIVYHGLIIESGFLFLTLCFFLLDGQIKTEFTTFNENDLFIKYIFEHKNVPQNKTDIYGVRSINLKRTRSLNSELNQSRRPM